MTTPLERSAAAALLPARADDSHKGSFGHVLLVGGSRGFTGAVKLMAYAAERSGTGLVTAGVPESLLEIVASALTESMTLPLPDTEYGCLSAEAATTALEFVQDKDAAALGPGIGRQDPAAECVETFVTRCPVPFVLDADGINALSGRVDILGLKQSDCILTPHPGEMARLLQMDTAAIQSDRAKAARDLAERTNAVIVLKGAGTIVASPDGQVIENPTGNHGLAKGGSGDVLTGLLAGLLAQGLACYDAARLGVYAHGLAADLAAEEIGARGMVASDVVGCLPEAWQMLESLS